jgi:hypothetical protein
MKRFTANRKRREIMNSESKPDLTGEDSRRRFMQKLGTVAAVSSVAASVSSAQQAPPRPPAVGLPGMADERNFRPEPGPLSKEPMPTIRLGKHDVSRLMLGINGIGTHYSDPLNRTFREWNTPAQLMEVLKHCEELGINCRIQTNTQVNDYNKANNGKMMFTCNGYNPISKDGTIEDPRPLIK